MVQPSIFNEKTLPESQMTSLRQVTSPANEKINQHIDIERESKVQNVLFESYQETRQESRGSQR